MQPGVQPYRPIGPEFGPRPLGPRQIGPITPQVDPNRDYGFNQYGFDSNLLNYLNRQKQGSFIDAGASYNYDPTTQTFSGGTMGAQYGNIPLSVLQQVATSGDRNLLQQYQTGGRNFNQPAVQSQSQQPLSNIQNILSGGTGGPRPLQGATPLGPINVSSANSTPGGVRGGMGPLPNNFGPMQGQVGDPRRGAAFIPGNPMQEIMRGPQQAPLQQQFSYGGRAGYQMGGMGIESLSPMREAMQPAMQSAMYSPLEENYYDGMPMMANGGRLGYQEGGMGMEMMPQQMESPEGIMSIMSPEAGGMQPPMQDQMQGQMMMEPQMQGQLGEGDNALLTIIQLLIERGVPPEQAEQLARQILQIFAEGGKPAVEEFANQLRQQEQSQAMASGGIVGYARRQDYFFGGIVDAVSDFVGGIGDAVGDVISSPIGQIALTIGAGMLIGPGAFGFSGLNLGAGLTSNAFLAGAINAGVANTLVQGITTGQFDPKQALLAGLAGGVTSGLGTGATNPDIGGLPDAMQPLPNVDGIPTPPPNVATNLAETFSTPNFQPNITPDTGYTGLESDISSMVGTDPNAAFTLDRATLDPAAGAESQIYNPGAIQAQPNMFQQGLASIQNFGTNLMSDPLGTLKGGFGSMYDYAKENAGPLSLGALAGASIRPQAPGESDEDYQRYLAEHEAEVAQYYNLYEGYMNPKPKSSLALAANGGRIGFEYGSMPMGEPRENPVGIMELDYRAKGGFVPPIGIKEKADDIPAMLSNNEFVFTANAVRNAGEGNVNKGAQRMYGLMKQLEAGGVV
jgi:hypothetical protein